MSTIAANLANIQQRIREACLRSGRDPGTVRLVAVSKMQSVEAIIEAYNAGQRVFGENYVQELARKAAALTYLPGIEWHLIGHLQRNKIKDVLPWAHLIESIDSLKLAMALNDKADQRDEHRNVLVQVNIAHEPQKSGCDELELQDILQETNALSHLSVKGLMTVPPVGNAESSRPHFAALGRLARHHGLNELSMGMSHDFEVAIEEGATLVRVGSAIFGPRLP